MSAAPRIATREDFAEIVSSTEDFWGERDVAHLHHPMVIEEFGDSALVIEDPDGRVAAYLFGMIVGAKRLGYVHAVAVRDDQRGRGYGRQLHAAFAELAATRGCTRIKAITAPTNAGSIAFHESLGMEAREVADYSGPGRSRVVMTRDLTPPPSDPAPPIDGVTLRPAALTEVDEILAFWQLAAEDADRPPDRPEAVVELISRDPDALLLAVRDGQIVGSVIAAWDGWRAHLARLAVHPGFRRRGLARWLLDAAEARLRAHGAIRLDAMVLDGNDSAHRVWSTAGYGRQESWSRWVKPIDDQPFDRPSP